MLCPDQIHNETYFHVVEELFPCALLRKYSLNPIDSIDSNFFKWN